MKIKFLAFSLALFVRLSVSADYQEVGIGKVLLEVDANSKSDIGAQFTKSADSIFVSTHLDSIKNCFEGGKAPSQAKVDAFFMLSRQGRIKDFFILPPSEQGKCFAVAMKNFTFPAPPGPNYWIRISVGAKLLAK